ncbi:hypothetical protein [Porticoccus sp.]
MNNKGLPKRSSIDEEYALYTQTISGDPVATVLRFHLLNEYYLEQMIRLLLPRGDRIIDSGNYSYAQKLGIVKAADNTPDRLLSSLRNLNKLRNKCSDERSLQITDSDLEKIGSPLGRDWTQIKKEKDSLELRLNFLFGLIFAKLSFQQEKLEQA